MSDNVSTTVQFDDSSFGGAIAVHDGMVNFVANLGTNRDKSAHTQYIDVAYTPQELLAMYRNSWLASAIVDYPAEDATRKWRFWRADADQITRIETLENTLGLRDKVFDALKFARLYGESAIYINTDEGDQSSPLQPGTEIKSLVVLSRGALTPDPVVTDISSPYYGKPEIYRINTRESGPGIPIHASRFAIFYGKRIPRDPHAMGIGAAGDSVLQATMDAIKGMDSTIANIASLVFEAKVDVLKVQGFADLLSRNEDARLLRRAHLQAAMKGINGMMMIDAQDDYDQKSASFAGLNEVVGRFQDNVAGAAGIPVTRLYGRAAVGLSGSGDGDERVYYDRIGHQQATEIGPAIALLDECIITQALGQRPDTIYYEWSPLRQISEVERADIFSKTATAARALAGATAGEVVPLDALSDALVNELTEQGVLPGLDQLVEQYGTLGEQLGFVEGGE